MDSDVARLVRDERLLEAAGLASQRGDAKTASALFERACDFFRAAEEALRAGDHARALALAREADDDEIAERALAELLHDPEAAERVSVHLERRGDHRYCARILEAIGKTVRAARAYERAGDAAKASSLLESSGDIVGAAKVLEAQLRREPAASNLLLALGSLLLRYGKVPEAIRSLQKIPDGSAERREALTLLVRALDQLGLAEARALAQQELEDIGGPVESEDTKAQVPSVRPHLFGRYEIVREVASSPSARVLECLDRVRGERVAVKIFAGYDARGTGRDALARFEREVRLLGSFNHPNIVPLREYVPEGPALVLAWMAHGTLEQMLVREPLTPARAVEIAQAMLAALSEAHRLGVIHRDVKPANVLFDDAGVTRVSDFGVAHLGEVDVTATAGIIGSFGYMSPEQREGRPATVRSDLYGVGAVLWEMLTGERPEFARTVQTRPSGAHRDLDARHDALVLSFLAEEPAERPEDALAARRSLGSLPWPDTLERAAGPLTERPKSAHPPSVRFEPQADGSFLDALLGRRVVAVALTSNALSRAAAFARVDHPALQAVLRVDRAQSAIWFAAPRGTPLRGTLSPVQSARLQDALAQLHDRGDVHGRIDSQHVWVDEQGEVMLTFAANPDAIATKELDRLALARLSQ